MTDFWWAVTGGVVVFLAFFLGVFINYQAMKDR